MAITTSNFRAHIRGFLLALFLCTLSGMIYFKFYGHSFMGIQVGTLVKSLKSVSFPKTIDFHVFLDKWIIPTANGLTSYSSIVDRVYVPMGYSICFAQLTYSASYWLALRKPIDCQKSFNAYLNLPPPHFSSPQRIPSDVYNEFTLQNFTSLASWYLNETYSPAGAAVWKKEGIDTWVARALRKENFESYYEDTKTLYQSLEKFSIEGKTVMVVGSQTPWVEAIAIAYKASHVTTIEYGRIISQDPRISYLHPLDAAKNWKKIANQFDVAITFSSLEHSGLGRYGDPLCASCDILEVEKIACWLRPGGLLFLAIPIGRDNLVFNAHRHYGPVRLPLMTSNWAVKGYFTRDANASVILATRYDKLGGGDSHAVIVLENLKEQPCPS